MGRIYYKGEIYSQEPPILANAIMMSEEQAREYNIVVEDSDEEEVVAYGGERVYLGDVVNDFIAGGIQVIQGTDEEFLAKVKPENAYTLWINPNGTKDDTITEATDTLVISKYSLYNWKVGRIYLDSSRSGDTLTLWIGYKHDDQASHYNTRTSGNLSNIPFAQARAYGICFQFSEFSSATDYGPYGYVGVYAWIVVWTKNENNEWEVLNSRKDTSGYLNFRIAFGSEGEYQYFMGIKGKYSYLTPEEFEELLQEHSPNEGS